MCLGVPGKVLSVDPSGELLLGEVDFGGLTRRVCLEHLPDIQPGDWVLVHVGFALSRLDEAEARRLFEVLGAEDVLREITGEAPPGIEPSLEATAPSGDEDAGPSTPGEAGDEDGTRAP